MSLLTWKSLNLGVLTLSVSAASLLGCAHTAAKVAAQPTAPAPVASAPVENPADMAEREKLNSLLKGSVAHFEFDQDSLNSDGQEKLQKVAVALKEHKNAAIRISGHCDELGTEEYNLALGQRRAQVAKKYLVALGVSADRIDTVSFGEEKPVAAGHDEEAHAQNRRDELEPLGHNKS